MSGVRLVSKLLRDRRAVHVTEGVTLKQWNVERHYVRCHCKIPGE